MGLFVELFLKAYPEQKIYFFQKFNVVKCSFSNFHQMAKYKILFHASYDFSIYDYSFVFINTGLDNMLFKVRSGIP